MFPKGVETGLFKLHPLATVKYKAATGLRTASAVLTSNVDKAKFLNIFMAVSFPIDSTCASGLRHITYE